MDCNGCENCSTGDCCCIIDCDGCDNCSTGDCCEKRARHCGSCAMDCASIKGAIA